MDIIKNILAEEIEANNFLKEKIEEFIEHYLPDLFFKLPNIDDHVLEALLEILWKAEELGLRDSSELVKDIEMEILNRQLEEEVYGDLEGESIQVEFKEIIPSNLSMLAKTIAAFSSTEGGRIYLGVNNDGELIGVAKEGPSWLDKLKLSIENFIYTSVKPTPTISINPYEVGNKTIVQIRVPKGPEPLYFLKNIPYIRRLTSSKPATPSDVKNLHLQYFIKTLQSSI